MKLLLVEDQKYLSEMYKAEFVNRDCKVFIAENGNIAFAMVQILKIDAILSDVQMPGMDGMELLKKLKEGPLAHIPVHIMTGLSPYLVEEFQIAGASGYYEKPLMWMCRRYGTFTCPRQ